MKRIFKAIIILIFLCLLLIIISSYGSEQNNIVSRGTADIGLQSYTGYNVQSDIGKTSSDYLKAYTHSNPNGWLKLGTGQLTVTVSKESNSNKMVVVTAGSLNVRQGPGTNYKIIRVLSYGSVVNILEERSGWYRIDDTGWISSKYTKSYTDNNVNKIAYLTFDDGPSKNNTPRVLDILKKYNIKATFFVNGYGKKDLYKRISDEGHVIGNHTFSHNYKTVYSSVNGFKKDVEKLSDFLEGITGKRPNILRFPGGSNNTVSRRYGGKKMMKTLCPVVLNDMEMQYFDWNVSTNDASTYRAKKDYIVRSALNDAKHVNRAIVLMHDAAAKTTTADALPEIIDGLIKMGFKFDVLTKDTAAVHFKVP